jgi:mannose-1-phosphate guanylyltransferase/phosphomannomutase
VFDDGRALLVMLDLVAAERRHGTVALPVTITRVAEQVTAFHQVGVTWTRTSPDDLARVAASPGLVFGGDGRGGFVVPEVGSSPDALATVVRLLGLVARTQLTLSAIDRRIPEAHVVRHRLDTPWQRKGGIMRAVLEAAGDRTVDHTDGCGWWSPTARGRSCSPILTRRSPGSGPRPATTRPPTTSRTSGWTSSTGPRDDLGEQDPGGRTGPARARGTAGRPPRWGCCSSCCATPATPDTPRPPPGARPSTVAPQGGTPSPRS